MASRAPQSNASSPRLSTLTAITLFVARLARVHPSLSAAAEIRFEHHARDIDFRMIERKQRVFRTRAVKLFGPDSRGGKPARASCGCTSPTVEHDMRRVRCREGRDQIRERCVSKLAWRHHVVHASGTQRRPKTCIDCKLYSMSTSLY